MKSKSTLALKNRTDELINDLNAVREAVLNKKRELGAEEYASLEPRLFESWVIEKLVQNESLVLSLRQELEELGEQLEELHHELNALRKNLPRPEKKNRK